MQPSNHLFFAIFILQPLLVAAVTNCDKVTDVASVMEENINTLTNRVASCIRRYLTNPE